MSRPGKIKPSSIFQTNHKQDDFSPKDSPENKLKKLRLTGVGRAQNCSPATVCESQHLRGLTVKRNVQRDSTNSATFHASANRSAFFFTQE